MKKKIKDFGREVTDNLFDTVMDFFENPYVVWLLVAMVCSIVYYGFSGEMSKSEYLQCEQLAQEAAADYLVEVPKGYSLTRYNDEELCTRRSGIFYHGAVYATKQDDKLVIERDFSNLKLVTLSLSFGLVASWFLLLFICGFVFIAYHLYKAAKNVFYEFNFISRREERLN